MEGIVATNLCEPISLLYLAAPLERHGVEVSVIDGAAEGLDQAKLESRIAEVDPHIIGVGCMMTETFPDAMEAVRTAKRAAPNAKIVMGGHHASFVADKIIDAFADVNYVVVGEGEHTFLDLVRSINNNGRIDQIKGITYRNNGRAVFTGHRPPVQNLDDVPFPPRHLVEGVRYGKVSGFQISNKKSAAMISSRGCPFGCTFCSCTAFSGRRIRARSPENVVAEIEYLINNFGTEQIFVMDDNFTAIPKRVMEICRLIKERNIDIEWLCESRVDTASEEMYQSMADAGCRVIYFGMESGSQRVLDYFSKKTTVERGEQAATLAQRAGIDVVGSFIVGAPVETEEDFQKTLDFITHADLDMIQVSSLKIYPGTELWRQFEASGAIKPEDWARYFSIADLCDVHQKEELDRRMKVANNSFFYRPTYIIKELLRTLRRRRDVIVPALRSLF